MEKLLVSIKNEISTLIRKKKKRKDTLSYEN